MSRYPSNAREPIYRGCDLCDQGVTKCNQDVTKFVTCPISESHAFACIFGATGGKLHKLHGFGANFTHSHTHTRTHTHRNTPHTHVTYVTCGFLPILLAKSAISSYRFGYKLVTKSYILS